MELPEEIKRIRQRSLLTQIDFAKEVKVAFSTVNRWECGKAKPNINAMKSIKEFCLNHEIIQLLKRHGLTTLWRLKKND